MRWFWGTSSTTQSQPASPHPPSPTFFVVFLFSADQLARTYFTFCAKFSPQWFSELRRPRTSVSRRVTYESFSHYAQTAQSAHSDFTGSRVYASLGVTWHLHCWQNDRALLRATAVPRGWNGRSPKKKKESGQKVNFCEKKTQQQQQVPVAPAGIWNCNLPITSRFCTY